MNDFEDRKAAFMGKITAGVTHEMKNVLAIIKESAGLMEDLIALHKGTPMPHQEKFSNVCNRIRQQVERGVDLAGRLNSFAHSPDQVVGEVDLNNAVEQVAFLAGRFARLKGVGIKVITQPEPVRLITDPLKIQMLLFNGIDFLLSLVQSNTVIVLQPSQDSESAVSVIYSPQGAAHEDGRTVELSASPGWSDLGEQASELTATVICKPPPGLFAVQFRTDRM